MCIRDSPITPRDRRIQTPTTPSIVMSQKSPGGRGGVAEMKASLHKKTARPLTAADLCDRCSARAAVETVMMQGERSQIRGGECSVGHVEVFRAEGVRTSIIGRPRPLPPHRRASHPVQSHQLATTPSFAKSPFLDQQATRTVSQVARENGVGTETLRSWVAAYRVANPQVEEPLSITERARLAQLEREVRELKLEKEFLGKAAAFFAREYR